MERLSKNQPISCPGDVKRFFVSPEESGQICMLACMLGSSGDIFFPKLKDEEMVYFKEITESFFKEIKIDIDICSSEDEAKKKVNSNDLNKKYPVYFFNSDTSGEKLYEEFYTDRDTLDLNLFESLGIVKNAPKPKMKDIEETINQLQNLLLSGNYDKSDIVNLLKKFIPDFEHIETGKSLDQKM